MAKLYNLQSKKITPVHDNMVNELIRAGSHDFVRGEEIPIVNLEGDFGTMPASDARQAIIDQESGFSYLPKEKIERRDIEREYGDPANQAAAIAEGAARTVSFGGSDIALKEMGVPYRDIENRRKMMAGTIGEVGGYFSKGPLSILGPVGKAIYAPLRATEAAGRITGKIAQEAIKKVSGKAAKDTVARKMVGTGVSTGVRGATEGAIIEGGHAITEAIARDEQINAEAVVARSARGGVLGFAFGSVLGAGMEAATKVAKKVDEKVIKSLSKVAGEDFVPLNLTLSKNIKGRNKQLADIPHLKLKKEPNQDTFTFSKGDKRIQINGNLEGKNVLDLTKPDDVVKFGEEINFLDLPEYQQIFSEKLGPVNSVMKAHVLSLRGSGIKEAFHKAKASHAKSITKYKKLKQDLLGVNRQINRKGRGPMLAAKQQKIMNDMRGARTNAQVLAEEIKVLKGKIFTKKDVSNGFKDYDAVKFGDDLYVLNPNKFDDLKTSSFVKKPLKERVKSSPEFALRAVGARTAEFRKLGKKGPGRVNEVGDFILDSYMETSGGNKFKGLTTSTDDLLETIERRELESISMMDESVAELTNELEKIGLDTGIKSSEISNYIRTELLTELVNKKTGGVKPGYSTLFNQLDDVSKEYNKYSRMDNGREFPLAPDEFRQLRISLDQITNFNKDDIGMNFFRRKIRNQMEDMLVSRMEQVDTAQDLVSHYKGGKKQYSLSQDALEIIEAGIIRSNSNNKIGLTSYGMGGAGATVGGVIGGAPGAIVGGITGTAVREFSRTRGDLLMALYGEQALKSSAGIKRRIGQAVKGFMTVPSVGIVIIAARPFTSEDLQDSYRKDFVNYKYNPEEMMEDFYEKNDGAHKILPDHIDAVGKVVSAADEFLREKLPKNPYPSNYFRAYTPSEMELRKFERYKHAVANPLNVIDELKEGTISNEGVEALKIVYPGMFDEIKNQFIEQMDKIKPDYRKRIQLDKMFGIKGDFYLEKQNINYLQQSARLIQEREDQKKSLAGSKLNIDNRNMTDAQAIGQA